MPRRPALALSCAVVFVLAQPACRSTPPYRTFASPEDAVKSLTASAKSGPIDDLIAIFGPESRDLVASNDPALTKRNREVFVAAVAERWRFEERGPDTRVLVIGKEDWPFPVPLVRQAGVWHFDTAAGLEEVLARRVGRNELAAILTCRTYVAAQKLYAARPHDGRPAGAYAQVFKSDPGRENGLYWQNAPGRKRSPLGDLVAQAAAEGAAGNGAPFHGYYFRIVPASGADMPAVVAWPAEYDVTGVMSFVAGADGVIREKDLGPDSGAAVKAMRAVAADASWTAVQ